ncbi:MAG: prolipoprotein diacylglyceryl transferase [Micrococcales bacterium]
MNILNSIPSPSISHFDIGPVRIHFYALFILLGIAIAIWIGAARFKTRGGNAGVILDIALWAVPFGIVGGRIFHVLTHASFYFGEGKDLSKIFAVWEGGLAIYGAIILGVVGAYIGARLAGVRFLSFADAIAPGVILAQAFGRLGNYFNQELFGTPTDLPWGLQIDSPNDALPVGLPDGTLFHPTFLYEIIWNLLGLALLLVIENRLKLRWGQAFGLYLVIYSIGRFWIEGLRIDPSDAFLGIRTNQWSAIIGLAVGAALIYWSRRRHPGAETSVYLPGREPEVITPDPDLYLAESQTNTGDELDSSKQ